MQQATWLVILNPEAGRGKSGQVWEAVVKEVKARQLGLRFDVRETRSPGHAITLVQQGIGEGLRQVICVGGDGTLNEVVNGLCLQEVVPSRQIRLAFLPAGTGTDWARCYKLPKQAAGMVDMLAEPFERLQDLGRVTYFRAGEPQTRYFANVAGMAFDAYIVAQQSGRPARGGQTRYLFGLLRYLFRYQSPQVRALAPGVDWDAPTIVANVGLGRYSGGGMQLVPRSLPDDGLFDLTLVEAMSPWQVLRAVYRLFDGSIYQHPKAHHHRIAQLTIEAQPGSHLEVDGEWIGELPATFDLLPRALRFVVPPH